MSSQSNILISQLIEDPNFYDDDDSVEVPIIPNGEIKMRLGHDGGPNMINYFLKKV